MSADEDFVLSKLAEVINDISSIAGMTFDEVWDAQFEGRSVTVVERPLDDGRTAMTVEFTDGNPDGSVVYSYRFETSESHESDGSAS